MTLAFRSRGRYVRPVLLACVVLATAATERAGAQSPRGVAPFLDADHWSVEAARRLHALGLVPRDFDPGIRSRSAAEWVDILDTAAARTTPWQPAGALVQAYRERFAREYVGVGASPLQRSPSLVRVALSTGYVQADGDVLAGVGFLDGDWTGARTLPDTRGAEMRLEMRSGSEGRVAFGLDAVARRSGVRAEEAYAAMAWQNLGAWLGRRSPGYGPAAGGGIVLSGGVPMTGAGLQLNRGVLLPGVLRVLGPVRLEGFVARADNMQKEPGGEDEPFRPYFGAARIAGSPLHPRFTLAATRGAMFGGEGNAPVTLRNVVTMLYGDHAGETGEFHQEVFAVDATLRPPLGALPLLLRVEWAMDDAAGMFYRAPGVVWAAELGAVPGLPLVGLGFERAVFSGCFECKNTLWYRNWYFREGWTDGGRLLGHPLGGHGREHRYYASLELPAASTGLTFEMRRRARREENLFAPDREGRSVLFGGRLNWTGSARSFLNFGVAYERGDSGWKDTRLDAHLGYRF